MHICNKYLVISICIVILISNLTNIIMTIVPHYDVNKS